MRQTISALVIAAGLAGFGMAAQAAPVPVAGAIGVSEAPLVQVRMHRERRMMRHRMMRHRMMRHRMRRRMMHRM